MRINVPPQAQSAFWDEPPEGSAEFWSFSRFPPPCKPGDPLVFLFDGVAVAEAVVWFVEAPGQSECEHSGKFRNGWKVYWTPESFRDLRNAEPAAAPVAAARTGLLDAAPPAPPKRKRGGGKGGMADPRTCEGCGRLFDNDRGDLAEFPLIRGFDLSSRCTTCWRALAAERGKVWGSFSGK